MPRTPPTPYARTRRRRRRPVIFRTGLSPRKAAYLAYMKSPAWRAFRVAWWARYDTLNPVRRCYCCGITWQDARGLELHHRTYERLGREKWEDIVAVCSRRGNGCHQWITRLQRSRTTTMSIWQITEARRKIKGG
jgi:hypothetical protein